MSDTEVAALAGAARVPPRAAPPLGELVLTAEEAGARDTEGRAFDPAIHRVGNSGRPILTPWKGRRILQRKKATKRALGSRVVHPEPVPPPAPSPGPAPGPQGAATPGGSEAAAPHPVAQERVIAGWVVARIEEIGRAIGGPDTPARPAGDPTALEPDERMVIAEDLTACLAQHGITPPPGAAAALVAATYLWRCSRTPEALARKAAKTGWEAKPSAVPADRVSGVGENDPGRPGGPPRQA